MQYIMVDVEVAVSMEDLCSVYSNLYEYIMWGIGEIHHFYCNAQFSHFTILHRSMNLANRIRSALHQYGIYPVQHLEEEHLKGNIWPI